MVRFQDQGHRSSSKVKLIGKSDRWGLSKKLQRVNTDQRVTQGILLSASTLFAKKV